MSPLRHVMFLSYVVLYCNVGQRVRDSVVHHSRQQSLIAKWLGLGLGLGPGNGIISFFFFYVK